MAEIDFEKLKIQDVDEETNRSVLISHSADRPNAFDSYRQNKKSASDVKAMFDAPFLLVKRKVNELIGALKNLIAAQNKDISDFKTDASGQIKQQNAKITEVYNSYKAGDFKGEKGDTYTLTEDDKSEIVQKISDESLADIEAALVYIISIQNKLLGVSEGLAFAAVEGEYEVAGIGECTDTDIVIPKMYEGALVVGIEDEAFYHCDSITSVIIPDSVTSIGDRAFADCSALVAVSIPDSVETIATTAFEDCSQLIYKIFSNARYLGNDNSPYLVLVKAQNTSITSCRIGSSTKLIYRNAFNECKDLENISVSAVDERDYTWVAQKKGIITFSSNCDFITVTHNDKIYGYEGTINGYLSISVNKDEPVDIRLIKNEGVNEGDAELDMTFTDGSYGSNLAWDKGITLYAQKQCNSTINDDNIKFTATDSSPSIQMNFREGHNRGRYLAIKYKSEGFYETGSYYFSAVDGDGRVINMSENSKFQHRTFVFTNDGAWHTLIIDTSEYMTGTSVNGQATHDGSQYAVTGLRLVFYNIAVDSEIFIKALELSDDKTFLQNKLAEV